MAENNSFKQIFQSMIPASSGIVEGKVTKIAPLQITVANDSKLILNHNTLVVPRQLTDHSVEMTMNYTTGSALGGSYNLAHTHTVSEKKSVIVHNSLKVGEIVYLLPFNNGNKYYVLDRKG